MGLKSKVLGVTYGGGHANIVIPILEALNGRGIPTQLLALTSSGPQAKRQGLPHKTYYDYKHFIDCKRAERLGRKLAETMHNENIGLSFEESIYYLGINLLENIETLGEDLAVKSLELAGRHSFLPVEFLKKIITEENCTHILTTNSPRSEKASLIAAQQLGLKSFRIDDLYGVPIIYDSLIRKMGSDTYYKTTGRFKITPTQSCFLCDFAQQHFISLQDRWDIVGVDSANSTVTGQPIFDAIDEVIKTRPANRIFPDRQHLPTVTWAHEDGHIDEKKIVEIIEQCFRCWGNKFNLAIKVRPNIKPLVLENILKPFNNSQGNIKVFHTNIDPNVLIWNSNVVVGQVSTMLTQAAYMGRPVVILDPQNLRAADPLVINKLAHVVRNAEGLFNSIKLLCQPESQMYLDFEKGCQKMNFKNQGTKNVCRLIEQYI